MYSGLVWDSRGTCRDRAAVGPESTTETLGPLVHVVVAAGTSLVCCIAGAMIALALNRSAGAATRNVERALATIREFYAAPLVDIAFLASLVALLGLAYCR
jgi:hypothetical protein